VFGDSGSELSELHDHPGDPQIDGELIEDGGVYVIRGDAWRLRRDDAENMPRVICARLTRRQDRERLNMQATG
jgi:hypothetical protein